MHALTSYNADQQDACTQTARPLPVLTTGVDMTRTALAARPSMQQRWHEAAQGSHKVWFTLSSVFT